MPIYEYECENCSFRFELRQSFSDCAEAACPKCQRNVKRVFSPVPIVFKGTGFYVTDSRNGEKGKLKDKEPKAAPVTSTGSESSDKSKEKATS